MTLPVFTPTTEPEVDEGAFGTHVNYGRPPTCAACGDVAWERDGTTKLCRDCWRAGPWAAAHLEARGLGSEAQEELRVLRRGYEMVLDLLKVVDPETWKRVTGITLPTDELGAARTAREVPRLTDEAGASGVTVSFALAPPPRRKP